jgi:hypothetical protein
MNNKTESSRELGSGSYLEAFIYRAPKKNHYAITQNLKKFIPWFEKNGARIEYYHLGSSETQWVLDSAKESGMEVMESIASTLSEEGDDDDIWMELQYFKDHNHCKEVYGKMEKDKSLELLGKESFSLVTQGKNLITGGSSRLMYSDK